MSMSDCCCPNTPAKNKQLCPECGVTCKGVAMLTLYHQVRFPDNQALIIDSYYFCPSKSCAIDYFSSASNLIDKQQLRCYQAIQNDALCYCFDIGTKHYLAALKAHCAEPIKDFVMQRNKVGGCASEIRNTSGQCCLANFKYLE
jgi:hypothetical protein